LRIISDSRANPSNSEEAAIESLWTSSAGNSGTAVLGVFNVSFLSITDFLRFALRLLAIARMERDLDYARIPIISFRYRLLACVNAPLQWVIDHSFTKLKLRRLFP
jgi:hypothetical protein